jgi:hypothetical protein
VEVNRMTTYRTLRRRTDLVAFYESSGTTSTENIDVDYREGGGRVGHSFRWIRETVLIGKESDWQLTAPLTHGLHNLLNEYHHYPPTMIKVRPFLSSSAAFLTQPQIWSMKKTEEAAAKKKPKTSAAQIRVQKGGSHPSINPV